MTQDQFNALVELASLKSQPLISAMEDVLVRGSPSSKAAAKHGLVHQNVYRCRAKLAKIMELARRARGHEIL